MRRRPAENLVRGPRVVIAPIRDDRVVAIGMARSGRHWTIALQECDRRAAGAVRRSRTAELGRLHNSEATSPSSAGTYFCLRNAKPLADGPARELPASTARGQPTLGVRWRSWTEAAAVSVFPVWRAKPEARVSSVPRSTARSARTTRRGGRPRPLCLANLSMVDRLAAW